MTKMKVILLIAGALFSVAGLTACSSFFYFPSQLSFFQPQKVDLVAEDVYFKNSENDSIHAWWFAAKSKQSKGTVVFFHGNAENMTTHFLMLHWLPSAGYNYLIFDYPGYGTSSGKPSQKSTVSSGVAALKWVYEHKDQRPLIVYGQSLGGNVAMRSVEELKGQLPVRNLVVESSFSSYRTVASRLLRQSWITWLLSPLAYVLVSNSGAPHELEGFSPIPMLFIHGDADRVVSIENTYSMFKEAKEPKQLWVIPSGAHGDTYFAHDRKYRELLLDYLESTGSK